MRNKHLIIMLAVAAFPPRLLLATSRAASQTSAVFSVHPENHRVFMYQGKLIVFDETFSGVVRGNPERYAVNRAEAWEMLLSGGAGYNNLDWSFTPQDESGSGREPIGDGRRLDGRCLREGFAILRELLNEVDLAALAPAVGLLPDRIPGYGYAASTDGSGRFLLYFVNERIYHLRPCAEGPLDVSLSLPAGRYTAEILNPSTGKRLLRSPLVSRGQPISVSLRFSEDIALVLGQIE